MYTGATASWKMNSGHFSRNAAPACSSRSGRSAAVTICTGANLEQAQDAWACDVLPAEDLAEVRLEPALSSPRGIAAERPGELAAGVRPGEGGSAHAVEVNRLGASAQHVPA